MFFLYIGTMPVLTYDKVFLSETFFDSRIVAEGCKILQTDHPGNQKGGGICIF